MCLHSINTSAVIPQIAIVYKGFNVFSMHTGGYLITPWLKGNQQYTTSHAKYKPDTSVLLRAADGRQYISGFHGYVAPDNNRLQVQAIISRLLFISDDTIIAKCRFTDITACGVESDITTLVAQTMQLRDLVYTPGWVDAARLREQLDLV